MQKPYLFLFFLLLFSCALVGQVAIVEYDATIATINGKQRSGYTKLYFTPRKAKYIHPNWPKKSKVGVRNGSPFYAHGDPEQHPIYTDLEKGTVMYKTDYLVADSDHFIFTDTIPAIDWTITEETLEILDWQAIKATGNFGGRKYSAWFTPEIAVPFGPYWFGGLPGLILMLRSEDGLVQFDFVSFSPSTDAVTEITPPTFGEHTDRESFQKFILKALYHTESFNSASGSSNMNSPAADYDIIRNRWTVIKKHKAERGY